MLTTSRSVRILTGLASLVIIIAHSPPAAAQADVASRANAEVTYDGLHRVDGTTMDAAWIKPDLDLGPYTMLLVVNGGISFKPVDAGGERWWPQQGTDTAFPISRDGKRRLADEMRAAFIDELSQLRRYGLVNEPGHGVLELEISLIDVVSHVPPPGACPGECDIYLTDVGEATLVLEMRDSETGEALVRAIDRGAAGANGWAMSADTVTVWPEVRKLAQNWAKLVRRRLDEITSVADLE